MPGGVIGIVNYGMGNLRSVQKALERMGGDARILDSPGALVLADRLVLPGVGAFADGMTNLRNGGWIDAIGGFIASGRPFLGICLGMQLLFDGSEEDAADPTQPVPGLSILPGRVVQFAGSAYGAGKLKVPHMGWNTITPTRADGLFTDIGADPAVYFVHSYYARPDTATDVAATTDYGAPICAAVQRDNIWATQFHPEKSQHVGLKMLENFLRLKP